MLRAIGYGLVALVCVWGFFTVRSAMTLRHAVVAGWYVSASDGRFYQLLFVGGFVMCTALCIWSAAKALQ